MLGIKDSKTLKLLGGVTVVAGAAALAASCGGSGGSGDADGNATAATIDTAGVTSAINDFGSMMAICQDSATGAMQSAHGPALPSVLLRSSAVLHGTALRQGTAHALALTSTPPADVLGTCGGRYGYRNYSHVNGVTTATLAFENYCSLDSSTGDKQTANGGIAFVNTATPTDSGPITTRLEASTSSPLTLVSTNAAGATVNAETVSFTAFKMSVGVPGGTPTAAKPNVMSVDDVTVRNDTTGKTYRETNYAVTQYQNAAGNSEWSMTGRGYRSAGTYYDMATTQPMVENPNGGMLSGTLTFTGAASTTAVATVVQGPKMQMKVSVNGTPITSVPACAR